MLKALLPLAIALSLAFSGYVNQQAMVVSLPKVTMFPSDVVVFYYSSLGKVSVLASEEDFLQVEKVENFDGKMHFGYVAISFKDLNVSWTDNLMFAFHSTQPIDVNVTLVHADTKTPFHLGSYSCPANITVEFMLPVKYTVYETTSSQGGGWQKLLLSAESPVWRALLYGAFFTMFGVSWLLDVEDFKKRKGKRWAKQDTLALSFRYFFYASLFILIISVLIALAKLIYSVFLLGVFEISLGMVVESSLIFALFAVMYGLAKWRDWFDVIDEEE